MSGSVLIVDDSLTVRMDLVEAFQAGGFNTVGAATAAEARTALAVGGIDAVVLDVLLPDADGVDLLTELRASPRHEATPIIMLSTEAEVKDRIRGLRTGADEYVGKPYDSGYLVAKTRQLLRAGASPATPQADRCAVLLVDDSPTFRAGLRQGLERAGYEVITATTGEEGLRIAADQHPGAIVVDGVLPGIDGATVIRRIRLDAALRDVPCLLLTASTDRAAELQVLDAGADAFVRKDEDIAVVLAKLAAVLRQATTGNPVDDVRRWHGPKKILAVDDSTTYLHTIGAALREDGYEVVLAHSGEEALELLALQPVDCILLDLLMPGLDGRQTTQRIKAAPAVRDIPLIMMTALDDPAAMLAGLSDGADDYIQKTDELDVLKARVRAQIRRKQFQDENRRIREQLLHKELEAAEARAARDLAETRAALVEELEWKNRELEAFSYSVSHDLRNPIQIVDAFSESLIEDYASILDESAQHRLRSIQRSARRMDEMIGALLGLSHANRAELTHHRFDLTALAHEVADELRHSEPAREVSFVVEDGLVARADRPLIHVLMRNLLGNAWKFTTRTAAPCIEVGAQGGGEDTTFFVRDNGAGFRAELAESLFRPFERLHSHVDFPGTGIGLATVHRIVDRHGGRIWADGQPGRGATFYFTVGPAGSSGGR